MYCTVTLSLDCGHDLNLKISVRGHDISALRVQVQKASSQTSAQSLPSSAKVRKGAVTVLTGKCALVPFQHVFRPWLKSSRRQSDKSLARPTDRLAFSLEAAQRVEHLVVGMDPGIKPTVSYNRSSARLLRTVWRHVLLFFA